MPLIPENEAAAERAESQRQLLKYAVCFGLLFCAVLFIFWWSGHAVEFSAGQITATNQATYRVWGVVRDARTGEPLAWTSVVDAPDGAPPYYRTDADQNGEYSLGTVPLLHDVIVFKPGYKPARVRVGKPWFVWWPRGEERLDVKLTPER